MKDFRHRLHDTRYSIDQADEKTAAKYYYFNKFPF